MVYHRAALIATVITYPCSNKRGITCVFVMMEMRTVNWRNMLQLGIVLGMAAFLVPRLVEDAAVNMWSLSYDWRATSAERGAKELPPAPEQHERAPLWLSREALEAEDPERVLELIQLDSESRDQIVLIIYGDALVAMNDFAGAKEIWIRAGNYQFLIMTATEAASAGHLDKAELAYRCAWEVNPLDGTLPLVKFLWQIRNDSSVAERILRQSLDIHQPSNLDWKQALGSVLRAQERWDEAIDQYRMVLRHKPGDFETLQLLGLALYLGKDDTKAALEVFQDLIQQAPEKGDGYFEIGRLRAYEGKYEEADQWFIQAIERKPDEPLWRVGRANTARDDQNISLALEIYTQTKEQFPDYAYTYYEMALAYKLNQQPEQAIHYIEQALALRQTPSVWYFLRAGTIYEWVGDRDFAIKAYKQALEIAPTNLGAQNALNRLDGNGG